MDKWYIRYYIEIPYTKQERKMERGEMEVELYKKKEMIELYSCFSSSLHDNLRSFDIVLDGFVR